MLYTARRGREGLPLWAELDVKRWPCRRGLANLWAWLAADVAMEAASSSQPLEASPTSRPGSPLMAMEATSTSSPPPGGSHTSRPGLPQVAMETKRAATANIVPGGG